MRRYLLYSFLIGALLLAACAAATPEPAPPEIEPATSELPEKMPVISELPESGQPTYDFSKPTFYLDTLPELAPFAAPREIINRYSEEAFVDTLIAAADYGRLYPYEGKLIGDGWWAGASRYGLVDARGRVVVDPVYRQANYSLPPDEGLAYLMLAYPVDESNADAQKLLRESDGSIQRGWYVFASADGAWVSDRYYGEWATLSEDRIIVYDYDKDAENNWNNQSYRIYDFQGRLIARGNGQIFGFMEGLGAVCHGKYDAQTDQYREYYDYIDKNGQVVIAGPFLHAENFVNGRATVRLGKDWDNFTIGIIDTQGNYLVEPAGPESMGYDLVGEYLRFAEDSQYGATRFGLKDMAGNIIVPAQYNWIDYFGQENTFTVGQKEDGGYWLIDLNGGGEEKIDLGGGESIIYASVSVNGWCEVRYEKSSGNGFFTAGVALIKDDAKFLFDAQDFNIYSSYIQDDLFAINYNKYTQEKPVCYTEILDVSLGKITERVDDYHYSHNLNDRMLIFYSPSGGRQLIMDRDFKPVFSTDDLGGDSIMQINHVADDVYSVRTTFCSGLIRENGQWLVRVYTNNKD